MYLIIISYTQNHKIQNIFYSKGEYQATKHIYLGIFLFLFLFLNLNLMNKLLFVCLLSYVSSGMFNLWLESP